MTRKSIAVDLDDVLAAHVEAFIEFSNANYGTHLTIEDYDDHWNDLWGVDRAEIDKRAAKFLIPGTVAEFVVKEEATAALRKLKQEYDLYIVTARGQHLIGTTTEWVEKHFKGLFKATHFVPIWDPHNQLTKGDICKQIGANYLIDDIAGHCNTAAASGVKAILFGDYAWNRQEAIVSGVIRCKNWDDVLAYLGVKA